MANLSFERLALVLALTGCSKATPSADTVRAEPMAPSQTASAMATTAAPPPVVAGEASATELKKNKQGTSMPAPGRSGGGGSTGQASCGAGSCTADIKKK